MKNTIKNKNLFNPDELFPNINNDIEHALTYFSDAKHFLPPVKILTEGHEKCVPNKKGLGPNKYNYYILHYVYSGTGYLTFENDRKEKIKVKINEKELFLISPKIEYFYIQDKANPWEYYWISFFVESNDDTISRFLPTENNIIKLNNYEKVEEAFSKITKLSDYKIGKNTAALGIFYEALSEIMESSVNVVKPDNDKNHIKECLAYIEQHYSEPDLSLKQIADHLYLNEKYLSRLFTAFVGTPLFQYINSIRIKMSCFELMNSSAYVSDIALKVGFEDPLYFSKKFKQMTGVSPLNYRKFLKK